ncbi:MAG: glutamate-1-semialdehyde 2,1-aminomutase [Planctomycetota bacterium]|nr:glutamate-1-semialdehyde 2,1-aminomutase [Planctomycetota bacterium]
MPQKGYGKSRAAFRRALDVMPGGVNSPVRAFRSVGGEPFFVRKAVGCRITDEDGNHYVDYVASWGAMIAGHAHPAVARAIRRAAGRGTSYGAPTLLEVELAEAIRRAVSSMEMLRLVSSGTEACAHAVRLARGFTKRPKIVKFDGCYHGSSDALLAKAGSGALTFGLPDSAGVTEGAARDTITVPYNDLGAARAAFEAAGGEIAAVIVEPVAGNMGVVPPADGFLEGLRDLCDSAGALLIFDEVITGFRVSYGGAQVKYGVRPDLTTLGKIIGGGLPCAAYGGRREIMNLLAPIGPVYQAGTLSGNPAACAAGLATLKLLRKKGVYGRLEERSAALEKGLREAAAGAGIAVCINRVGSMLTVFFREGPVVDRASASGSDTVAFARFHAAMLEEGIFLPPSQFEAWFVGLAHGEKEIEATIRAARKAFRTAAAR